MECTIDEECNYIEAMELQPRENRNYYSNRGNRGLRTNCKGQGRGKFGCGNRKEYTGKANTSQIMVIVEMEEVNKD